MAATVTTPHAPSARVGDQTRTRTVGVQSARILLVLVFS